ncbi:hypothetical protein Taro_036270 [Colocasia esculenta]|uniref:Uncharacterized protein n=1 Tax=Colocasia esculenta TaxID=4460 RepID=A0A843W144_COLES|nr:hypothetical protein [Colocasia esculenta]
MKGPGLFSDIGKKGKDLLFKDYTCDQKLTFSTSTATGLGLTTTAVKKGGLCVGDVTTKYKFKNTTVDLKVDTESNISSTVTLEELLPFTKAITTFKFPDYNSGKLEVQYFHDHAGVAGVVALKQSPTVDFSATLGAHGIVFGAEAGFDTSSGAFTKYNAGLSFTKSDYVVAVTLADKGDTLKASYLQQLNEKQKSAAVAEITRKFSTNENTITVGGLYELDAFTTVKTRFHNNGKLGALLQHQLKPNNVLTISGEFDTKALDKQPRFGLGLAIKP